MTPTRYAWTEMLRRLLLREYWNLGVVPQSAADIARHGITAPVRWLPPPRPGTMLADPGCLLHEDGGMMLLAEYMDYRLPRGEIWRADIAPGQDPVTAQFRPLLRTAYHMSYPMPLSLPDGVFLTCESWQSNSAPLWRWPQPNHAGAPVLTVPLLDGSPVVDPTPLYWEGRWWLFCTLRDDEPESRLHLYHAATPQGPWIPHPQNPIQTGRQHSRPAGPVFETDGALIRPAQDCSTSYGGALALQRITVLTEQHYREETLRVLRPSPGLYPHGLHTLCPAGAVTWIDGKRWGRDPQPIARQVWRKGRRVVTKAVEAIRPNLG